MHSNYTFIINFIFWVHLCLLRHQKTSGYASSSKEIHIVMQMQEQNRKKYKMSLLLNRDVVPFDMFVETKMELDVWVSAAFI